jgi:hypothetical protein
LRQATIILALLGAIVLAGCGPYDTTGATTINIGSGNEPYKPKTHLLHRSIVSNYFAGALDMVDTAVKFGPRLTNYTFTVGSEPTYLQSSPDSTLALVNNTGSNTLSSFNEIQEAVLATVQLGGWTQSFVTSQNNLVGFAAVPNLSNGNPPVLPGGIVRFNPTDGSLNTDIPFPDVLNLAMDPAEKHLLAFTDVEDDAHWVDLAAIDPATQVPPYYSLVLSNASGTPVTLSHPVAAFFSADGTKAYILSCGFECGGTSSASVTAIATSSITPPTPPTTGTAITATVLNQWTVSGARIGLIDLTANNLYVAGSTMSSTAIDCPFADVSNATLCAQNLGGNNVQDGYLTVIDLKAGTAGTPIRVGNGTKRWIRNIKGVYWVASLNCGVESCVSLVHPAAGTATVLATANGDATGISLASNSGLVYTIEGGYLKIYDQKGNPVISQFPTNLNGQANDILYID